MNRDSPNSITDYIISLSKFIETQDEEEPNEFLPRKPPKDYSAERPCDLLSHLQTQILKLLSFKSLYTQSDLYEIAIEIEKFEKLTQHTEDCIRKKIAALNELRLKLQDRKWAANDLRAKSHTKKASSQVLEDQLDFLKMPKRHDEGKVKQNMSKKIQDIEKTISQKSQRIEDISKDNERLSEELKAKDRELKILKKEKRRIGEVAHNLLSSPRTTCVEDLTPNYQCSIFLSSIIERRESLKNYRSPKLASSKSPSSFTSGSTGRTKRFSFPNKSEIRINESN